MQFTEQNSNPKNGNLTEVGELSTDLMTDERSNLTDVKHDYYDSDGVAKIMDLERQYYYGAVVTWFPVILVEIAIISVAVGAGINGGLLRGLLILLLSNFAHPFFVFKSLTHLPEEKAHSMSGPDVGEREVSVGIPLISAFPGFGIAFSLIFFPIYAITRYLS